MQFLARLVELELIDRERRLVEPARPYRAKSGDRREPGDTGADGAGIQAGQAAQGCRE